MLIEMYKHKFLVRRKSFVWSDLYTYYGDNFPKAILQQISATITDLNGHHQNFQKDSWLRVLHSCHKQSMLQLRPVEETPALPAAMLFKKKNSRMINNTRPLNGSSLFFRHTDHLGSRGDGVTIAINNIVLYTEMLQECLGIVCKHLSHRRVLTSKLLN